MDEEALISSLHSYLDTKLSVPVRTKGFDDQRPLPLVLIDDWNTRDFNFHNSPFAGEFAENADGNGKAYERYLNFDFETTVEILVRHSDEVDASRLKGNVKRELRLLREYPQFLHSELKGCSLGADGSPRQKFLEPTESEEVVSARFHADHTIVLNEEDVPENVLDAMAETIGFNS